MWTVLIGTLFCVNIISGQDHHLLRRSTENVTHAVNKVRERRICERQKVVAGGRT